MYLRDEVKKVLLQDSNGNIKVPTRPRHRSRLSTKDNSRSLPPTTTEVEEKPSYYTKKIREELNTNLSDVLDSIAALLSAAPRLPAAARLSTPELYGRLMVAGKPHTLIKATADTTSPHYDITFVFGDLESESKISLIVNSLTYQARTPAGTELSAVFSVMLFVPGFSCGEFDFGDPDRQGVYPKIRQEPGGPGTKLDKLRREMAGPDP